MKQVFTFFAFCCLAVNIGWAQVATKKNNDWAWIRITPVIAEHSEPLSENLNGILLSKMGQLLDANKVGAALNSAPFNMVATLVVNQADVTRTTPVRYSVSCSLTFQIMDARTGDVFGAITRDLRGIGANKNNAIQSALTGINARAPYFKVFVDGAKSKIKENYESQALMSEAAPEVPASAPADDVPLAAEANGQWDDSKRLALSKTITMEYVGAESYGERLYLHFALTNSGSTSSEIALRDMIIFDWEGTPYKKTGLTVGKGEEESLASWDAIRVLLAPGVRTIIKCTFPKIDTVSACQFTYEKNKFAFSKLALTPPE